jgi:hypothetical protein
MSLPVRVIAACYAWVVPIKLGNVGAEFVAAIMPEQRHICPATFKNRGELVGKLRRDNRVCGNDES